MVLLWVVRYVGLHERSGLGVDVASLEGEDLLSVVGGVEDVSVRVRHLGVLCLFVVVSGSFPLCFFVVSPVPLWKRWIEG